LRDWTIDGDGASGLLVSFTNVDSRRTAEKLAARILMV